MAWRAKIAKPQSPAKPASSPSPSARVVVTDAEPWSTNFHAMSLHDQLQEIIDHVKRLRAEVAALRADLGEHLDNENTAPHPDSTQTHAGSRGDMTGGK